MNINWLLLILVIGTGIQAEGGKITQADINFSQNIYISNNFVYDVLWIDGNHYYITTEIHRYLQNPFINEGFLYFEIV